MNVIGITNYGVLFNRMVAQTVYASLKARGYVNIHLWVFNGHWIAKVDLPGTTITKKLGQEKI